MKAKIDFKRLVLSVAIIAFMLFAVVINLHKVQNAVNDVYNVMSHELGWFFIVANIAAFAFSVWIVFSPKGKIRLGGKDVLPEFGNFSWVAMMFTTSCSAGLLIFGFTESVIYVSSPPFQAEPFSIEAYEFAQMYSHYHWGLNAWALYVPASIAISYVIYNKRDNSVSVGKMCAPILGRHACGTVGILFDVFGTFGAVVAPVTSMGLGMPLLTGLLQRIFGIGGEYETVLYAIILSIWIVIFGTSVILGLSKGIKRLSNINAAMAFAFMFAVGIMCGPLFVIRAEVNTVGLYIQNFFRMITYTDPYGDGNFVADWTVWYWAWLIVYMPLMGIFNARISKGRTLRQVAIGQMVFCSLGSWIAMSTLGNYAIKLQMGGVDIAKVLTEQGHPQAVITILENMPLVMMVIAMVLIFIFMATTVDSSSFVAAELTSVHMTENDLAPRSLRIFWAAMECIITLVLLKIGGFSAVQVLALLVGLPLAVVLLIMIFSAIKLIGDGCNSDDL